MHERLRGKMADPRKATPGNNGLDSIQDTPHKGSNASGWLAALTGIESPTATMSYGSSGLPERLKPNEENAKPVQADDCGDDRGPGYANSIVGISSPKRNIFLANKNGPKIISPDSGGSKPERAAPPDGNKRSSFAWDRRKIEAPKSAESRRLAAGPRHAADLADAVKSECKKSKTDAAAPHRAKLWIINDKPSKVQSDTAGEKPNRTALNTKSPTPRQLGDCKDAAKPAATLSEVASVKPALVRLRGASRTSRQARSKRDGKDPGHTMLTNKKAGSKRAKERAGMQLPAWTKSSIKVGVSARVLPNTKGGESEQAQSCSARELSRARKSEAEAAKPDCAELCRSNSKSSDK